MNAVMGYFINTNGMDGITSKIKNKAIKKLNYQPDGLTQYRLNIALNSLFSELDVCLSDLIDIKHTKTELQNIIQNKINEYKSLEEERDGKRFASK
jgi:hypothetical protein